MNYVILHYFFTVHLLCYIKTLAISSKINLTRYDIDGFLGQVLKSQKFDELSDKLAEKAANKILSIQADQGAIKKINSNHDDSNTDTDNTHQKKPSDGNLKKDKKIDLKAVIMSDAPSKSENLKLNYKYLTKQAVMKANQDLDEDPSKDNMEGEVTDKKIQSYANKSVARTMQGVTDKKELSGKILRNGNRTNVEKDSGFKGNSEMHSSAYEDTPEKSKDRRLKKQGHDVEQINSNESQNSVPQFKDILKQGATKENNVKNKKNIRKFLSPSEERSEAARRRDTVSEEDNKKHSASQSLHEESVDYNKVTSDSVYNPYRHYRSSSSESGSRSARNDRSPEERTREQERDNKFRPVMKREGDKLYRYVEAPEYKDYHEDRMKWKKVHPENPADFM